MLVGAVRVVQGFVDGVCDVGIDDEGSGDIDVEHLAVSPFVMST